MAVFHVFLLVLVIGIVHHSHGRTYESENMTINGKTDTPKRYDYFSLVLQWPKSFCNTGGVTCTSPIPNNFTVHGLWPQRDKGPMTTCNTGLKKLDYTKLDSSVLNYMNINWPNLNARHNNINYREWLWDHEYQKHGSCFLPFQTQSSLYFQKTVEMAKHIGNVTDKLLHPGKIQPDDRKYRLRAFENAIFGHLKFIPRLRCNYYFNALRRKIIQLYEIEFCFENNWAPRNCSNFFGHFSKICGYSRFQPNPLVMFPRPL